MRETLAKLYRLIFGNVGKTLCNLALFNVLLGFIGAFIGIICVVNGEEMVGIILLVAGVIVFLSSIPMFAFGQITTDVHEMKKNTCNKTNLAFNDLPKL